MMKNYTDEQFDDVPPPYSASAVSSTNHSTLQGSDVPQSSLFSSRLAGIRSQISTEQAARISARDERDTNILSVLVPHVDDVLSSISGIHPTPRLVEAILVPGAAIDPEWKYSDDHEQRSGEFRKLILVRQNSKLASDKKSQETSKSLSDDSWSSSTRRTDESASASGSNLWWDDESMARRLAKHLQPTQPSMNERQQVPLGDETPTQNGKKSRWGLFKKADEPAGRRTSHSQGSPSVSSTGSAGKQGTDVTMSVRAEEVTFRKENEFGLWETKTGWGLVIRVRIQNI